MKKKRKRKMFVVSQPSTLTVERLAMAMTWSELPSQDREYARNRARDLLDKLGTVIP